MDLASFVPAEYKAIVEKDNEKFRTEIKDYDAKQRKQKIDSSVRFDADSLF